MTRRQFFLLLCAAAIVFTLGFLANSFTQRYEFAACASKFSHLNASAACGNTTVVINKTAYAKLEGELSSYIDTQKIQGSVREVSVYFRDLQDGPVFGINDNNEFAPASLLKLPIALIYMDLEEDQQPDILNQTIAVDSAIDAAPQTYPPKESAEVGKTYTIKNLIFMMLAYSDNASLTVLVNHLAQMPQGENIVRRAFQDLGIIDPNNPDDQTVDVHSVSTLYRLLYKAAYLSPEHSEEVLSMLSQSQFKDGLEAGVPAGVGVAHKFGERIPENSDGSVRQFHDCGIVYYPGNPYTLCIMTEGTDTKQIVSVIAHISAMVYAEVDSRQL